MENESLTVCHNQYFERSCTSGKNRLRIVFMSLGIYYDNLGFSFNKRRDGWVFFFLFSLFCFYFLLLWFLFVCFGSNNLNTAEFP